MSQSLSKIYVHVVFHTKYNKPFILPTIEKELYAYIAGIIKSTGSQLIKINGTQDHVHILVVMSKNIALSKFLEEIKRNSSRWIKTKGQEFSDFVWQGGYAAFSVSPTNINVVVQYIENQKDHHKKVSFKEEYVELLKLHGIEYNEDYLWG
jgi:REP element-mobilizing transposase RayT